LKIFAKYLAIYWPREHLVGWHVVKLLSTPTKAIIDGIFNVLIAMFVNLLEDSRSKQEF
jgi:hypothetical protein